MKRGTVVWVNLSDARPPEMDKVRPAVVLSNSVLNGSLNTLVVVPLSTQPGEIWPLRVKVTAGGRKPSFAVIPGLRQVSKARLLNAIAALTAADLAKIERAVANYLAD
ncbi:type II toxin-antitoxin system PemK/MazF family toxin [Prosthecobacter sp.]|uniref:type II toxin-antitoxin system PemK/MazF family toxin n=1 Tax=Prosthecobacter sp. TaxID=1965333 RepID=UPI002ABA7E73|nr:type II toxin-antitoxin system PemK/MazF family toxin [Prosthecobacter sp.]MDZ4403803.1 type II toxin-antitoxin system PemK/MazF family toxin [Prosthecobacter sp.]